MKNIKEITDIFKQEIKKKYTAQITMPVYMGVSDMEIILEEIARLNNIIKQQNTRNSRQRIANRKLQEENNLLKQIIGNDKKYSYGIRMGSDKE